MIVFQVSLNFDPVKEILKIRSQVYILIKKVIILGKIHMTIKSFAPPFFNYFSLSLDIKKRAVMRAIRKKLNIFTLQLPIHYTKTKREVQFVFVVERWMQCSLFRLKSQRVGELSCHPGFIGNFLTISHTC